MRSIADINSFHSRVCICRNTRERTRSTGFFRILHRTRVECVHQLSLLFHLTYVTIKNPSSNVSEYSIFGAGTIAADCRTPNTEWCLWCLMYHIKLCNHEKKIWNYTSSITTNCFLAVYIDLHFGCSVCSVCIHFQYRRWPYTTTLSTLNQTLHRQSEWLFCYTAILIHWQPKHLLEPIQQYCCGFYIFLAITKLFHAIQFSQTFTLVLLRCLSVGFVKNIQCVEFIYVGPFFSSFLHYFTETWSRKK